MRPNSTNFLKNLQMRENGIQSTPNFQDKFCGSEDIVRRLDMKYNLIENEKPSGSLNFNQTGTKLASSSEDGRIIVWDWSRKKKLADFDSGHKSARHTGQKKVRQVMFMSNDSLIASIGGDCKLILTQLSSTGENVGCSAVGKRNFFPAAMALVPDSPKLLLTVDNAASCGGVSIVDMRERVVNYVHQMSPSSNWIINSNPSNYFQFCISSGKDTWDSFIRIFDLRFLGSRSAEVFRYRRMGGGYVTNSVFSKSGHKILGSYSDGYMWLGNANPAIKYQNHFDESGFRNRLHRSMFFGPASEFVISKSRSEITFWNKETGKLLDFSLQEEGIADSIPEPHPNLPFLATAAADGVNMWLPECR